jgi:putative hemolysin
MLDTQQVLATHFPAVASHKVFAKPVSAIFKRLLCEQEINHFAEQYPHLSGFDFVEQVLDFFSFTYSISDTQRERIPESGKVVIIANHPIGSLDGLALIKCVREIRSDIKVVANDMLMAIEPMHELLLPVNNMKGNTAKQNLKSISEHLNCNGAVLIFPAGEVSRLRPQGIRDGDWHHGFLKIAKTNQCPILPVFINAKNSSLFYGVSMLYKPAATAMLVKEMFYQRDKNIQFKVGDIIPVSSFQGLKLPLKEQVKLFKKHLYRIPKNKDPLLITQSATAQPEERRALLKALKNECEILGETPDRKVIYLYKYTHSSPIMRELGRLRELTFRAVGEGSNKRRDVDKFDKHYIHLILWDEEDLEIAGAYRFGDAVNMDAALNPLYSSTLFDYQDAMQPYFARGLELGRSFVQQKYWGKRSLDYLWMGIGAFLTKHPEYRYLFGPVTISGHYPKAAVDLISAFFLHYFPSKKPVAYAKNPYQSASKVSTLFEELPYKDGLVLLKAQLANLNLSLPTLYKQYAEICEGDGVSFSAFNIDPDFQNCIDGLVIVDIAKLKARKKARYMPHT